jgi:hypothetical protein
MPADMGLAGYGVQRALGARRSPTGPVPTAKAAAWCGAQALDVSLVSLALTDA